MTKPHSHCIAFFLRRIPVLVAMMAHASVMAQVMPADRLIEWNPGVKGGIPERTVVFSSFASTATAAQIQAALDACPSNQVVSLAEGTFRLTAPLSIRRDGVTLRGAGAGRTVLMFETNATGQQLIGVLGSASWNPPSSAVKDWTGGFAKGTTTLTVSDTAGMKIGSLLVLDQTNDPNLPVISDSADLGRGLNRSQSQVVRITGVEGNTVAISPGLYMSNWSASRSPQVWWWTRAVTRSGVENLTVTRHTNNTAAYNFNFQYVDACWLKGVESEMGGTAHVWGFWSKDLEFRDSHFHHCRAYGVTAYGIEINGSCDALIENNVFHYITTPVLVRGGSQGCVVGYNFSTNLYNGLASWMAVNYSANHRSHPAMNLYEGNFGTSWYADYIHGSSSHLTLFRNFLSGHEPGKDNNTYPVVIESFNRHLSIVGNVLGTPGYHTLYEYSVTNYAGATTRTIYRLGFAGTQNTTSGGDPEVMATLFRHGNFDYASGRARWADGFSTNLPASLYLREKPAWFGNRPFPFVDIFNPARCVATNHPAGYRFVTGLVPPENPPTNSPPSANAAASPLTGAAPLAVSFSSAGSLDPEGAPLSYEWSLGDGNVSSAANPSHTYSTAGNYTARLTVSDGTNTSAPAFVTVNVTNSTISSAAPLVAAYGFEEAKGTVTGDETGNGNSGTIVGASWTTGKFGKGLLFRTNTLVRIESAPSLNLTSGFTLEAWVYPAAAEGWMNLIYKPLGSGVSYVLQGSSLPGKVPSVGASISPGNVMAPAPLPPNAWSHVAGTYDGQVMRLYINGTLVSSRAQTGNLATSAGALTLGGNALYGESWQGIIDEVRIYNRALSAGEILADMSAPVKPGTKPAPPKNLRLLSSN